MLLSTHWLDSWPDSTHKCNLKKIIRPPIWWYVKPKTYSELSYSQSPCPPYKFSLQSETTEATVQRIIKYRKVGADGCHSSCEGHSSYGPILFLILINDLSDNGKSSLSLCWWLHPLPWHPSSFRQASSSLFPIFRLKERLQDGQILGICLSILTNGTLSRPLPEGTIWQTIPSAFLTILLRMFSHSNSSVSLSATIFLGQTTFQCWPPKLAADCGYSFIQSPFLAHLNSNTPTRLSSSAWWSTALPSRLALLPHMLESVETKAFKIIWMYHIETLSMGLSICHRRQVGGLSVFYRLLSGLAPFDLSVLCATPTYLSGNTCSTSNPFWWNSLNPGSLLTSTHLFQFSHLWNQLQHSIQSHSSLLGPVAQSIVKPIISLTID